MSFCTPLNNYIKALKKIVLPFVMFLEAVFHLYCFLHIFLFYLFVLILCSNSNVGANRCDRQFWFCTVNLLKGPICRVSIGRRVGTSSSCIYINQWESLKAIRVCWDALTLLGAVNGTQRSISIKGWAGSPVQLQLV